MASAARSNRTSPGNVSCAGCVGASRAPIAEQVAVGQTAQNHLDRHASLLVGWSARCHAAYARNRPDAGAACKREHGHHPNNGISSLTATAGSDGLESRNTIVVCRLSATSCRASGLSSPSGQASIARPRVHWQTVLQQDQQVPVAGVEALRVWVRQSIAGLVHTSAVTSPARAGGRHGLVGQCDRTLSIDTHRSGWLGGGRRGHHALYVLSLGARTETSPLEGSCAAVDVSCLRPASHPAGLRLHAVLCELTPGRFSGEITAAQATAGARRGGGGPPRRRRRARRRPGPH